MGDTNAQKTTYRQVDRYTTLGVALMGRVFLIRGAIEDLGKPSLTLDRKRSDNEDDGMERRGCKGCSRITENRRSDRPNWAWLQFRRHAPRLPFRPCRDRRNRGRFDADRVVRRCGKSTQLPLHRDR
jgi:hypothetical protein